MPSLEIASATIDAFRPDYTPVGVFIGGTSGVGQAMVKRLAQSLKGNIHLIIVGRNKAAAQSTLDSLPNNSNRSMLREFVYCEASLMENMESASDDIQELLTSVGGRINFLVHSAGYAAFLPVETTKDGLDHQLVMRYYSRWKFFDELLPLVQNAKASGEVASVMSVMAGGHISSGNIDPEHLDLDNVWSFARPLRIVFLSAGYNDLMVEEFSLRNPNIAFTHIFPGAADPPGSNKLILLWLLIMRILRLIYFKLTSTPIPVFDSSEWMVFALLDAEKGFFSRTGKGDDVARGNFRPQSTETTRKALWEHSRVVTRSRPTGL